jgi:hypothetical protein
MSGEAKKIDLWRRVVVYGVAFLFVMGVPSLPGGRGQHLLYWCIAFVIELLLCATLLGWGRQN